MWKFLCSVLRPFCLRNDSAARSHLHPFWRVVAIHSGSSPGWLGFDFWHCEWNGPTTAELSPVRLAQEIIAVRGLVIARLAGEAEIRVIIHEIQPGKQVPGILPKGEQATQISVSNAGEGGNLIL